LLDEKCQLSIDGLRRSPGRGHCLGVPCATLRENTERPVTVSCGTKFIAGTTVAGIRAAVCQQMSRSSEQRSLGRADRKRIVALLASLAEQQLAATE